MEKLENYNIINSLKSDTNLYQYQRVGLCRVWSKNAKEVLLAMQPDLRIEIREVDIEPGLSHTFLRVYVEDNAYLLDGTGVAIYPAYFGLEREAPKHLLESSADWIDIY